MQLTHTRLLVEDMQKVFTFYAKQVGLTPRFGDVESVYHEFVTGSGTLGLYDAKLMGKALGGKGKLPRRAGDRAVLCFDVPDVDVAYNRMKANGVKFLRKPHNEKRWFLRVAHFRDPEGNLVEISHNLPPPPATK